MANIKISQLTSLSTMTDAAVIPVVDSGVTQQISGANLKTYFTGSYGNANVVANLAALGSNPISTTGNVTAGNLDAVDLVINSIRSDDSSFVNIDDGVNVTGDIAAAGNITAGNVSTGVITLTNGAQIRNTAGNAVAFGLNAGQTSQGDRAVAIGLESGTTLQGVGGVAIGEQAGHISQGVLSVAIGYYAGSNAQSFSAVAIGAQAGETAQGSGAIAIGDLAGRTSQASNSIIINATGANLDQTTANTFTVAPVRNDVANTGEVVFYNATSKEITYGNTISVAGNITANNFVGNGSQLTDLLVAPSNLIENGNSNVAIATANGNVTVTASTATWQFDTDGNLTVAGNINFGGDASAGPTLNDFSSVTSAANFAVTIDSANSAAAWRFEPGNSDLGEFDELPLLRTPTGNGSVIYNETLMAVLAGNIDAGERSSVRLLEGGVSLLGTTSLDGELSTIIMEVNTGGVGIRALGDAAPRLSVVGNVTGGNILTAGSVSATGNITGGNILGNGQALTSILFSNTSDATAAGLTVDDFYLSASTALSVTNSGSSAYLFDQYPGNNPTIYAVAGSTLAFRLAVTGHPFLIQSSGANYSTGLNHVTTTGTVTTAASAQGQVTGTLYWKIPGNAVGTYTYQCSVHGGMVGNIVVSSPTEGSFASLSVTGNVVATRVQNDGNLEIRSNVAGTARTWTFDAIGDFNLPVGGNISGSGYVTAVRVITDPRPLANLSAVAGGRAFVSDGNLVAAGNFGVQIGGGGANTVPVYSDGSNWFIG